MGPGAPASVAAAERDERFDRISTDSAATPRPTVHPAGAVRGEAAARIEKDRETDCRIGRCAGQLRGTSIRMDTHALSGDVLVTADSWTGTRNAESAKNISKGCLVIPYRPMCRRLTAESLLVVIGCAVSVLSCSAKDAGNDCREARQSCEARGMCWRLVSEGETSGSGTGSYDVSNKSVSVSASGNDARSCTVECTVCEGQAGAAATLPDAGTPLERAIVDLAQQMCARDFLCEPVVMRLISGDEAYCAAELARWLLWASTLPDSGATLDGVSACSTALARAGCGDAGVCLAGTRANGASCATGEQCRSGWCAGSPLSCGTCAVPSPLGGADGAACDETRPCRSHYSCIDGACRADARTTGQSCGPDVGQPYCEQRLDQLACDTTDHTCKSVSLADPGTACPTFGWCAGLGACSSDVCTAGPGPGDPCLADGQCRWPAVCVGGTCRGAPTGNPCGS